MIERAASGKSSSQIPAWRFYYWGGVAALFAWVTWQRFTLPLDPIADLDTWGYLSPALRKLLGADFGYTYGRNFIYPAFLFSMLGILSTVALSAIGVFRQDRRRRLGWPAALVLFVYSYNITRPPALK